MARIFRLEIEVRVAGAPASWLARVLLLLAVSTGYDPSNHLRSASDIIVILLEMLSDCRVRKNLITVEEPPQPSLPESTP